MIGNLGNKDRAGRQVRIEHRGRNLRISRTGGFSLRQAVRAGRLGLAANTSRGLRLSSAMGRGTQVATQNGRFILRGRYGTGPVKFNLSKSGMSASLASDIGRLNLSHPGRSSARLFGVQVRGQKAAYMNLAAMLVSLVVALIQFVVLAVIVTVRVLIWLGAALVAAARALVDRWRIWREERGFRMLLERIEIRAGELEARFALPEAIPDDRSRYELLANLLLRAGLPSGSPEEDGLADLVAAREVGSASTADLEPLDQMAWTWLAATALFAGKSNEAIIELILALDDLCLAGGEKTEAQEDLLAILAEAGSVRVTVPEDGAELASLEERPGPEKSSELARPFRQALAAMP